MISTLKRGLELYLSNILLYGLGIVLILFGPYYPGVLSEVSQKAMINFYFGYIFLAPFYYLIRVSKYSVNKTFLIIRSVTRNVSDLLKNKNRIKFLKEERVAFLFILVKLFYLPLIILHTHQLQL